MRRKLLLVAAISMVLALTITGTIAYYTTSGIATNVVTTGNLKAELVEMTAEGTPFEDVIGVMPGAEVSKIVSVKNTGISEAWVRVKVSMDVKTLDENVEVDYSLTKKISK